ncbi:hypothetical protein IID20_01670 [Patescibacteria group bacterium]|nr:hypothetical protein [Patescibacteria group bacterium]
MNPNKWEELLFKAEEMFGIEKKVQEDFVVAETFDGKKIMGTIETVEFKSPMGMMRLEKTSRPKVIEKKVLHTKRIGGKIAVDFIYSDQEKVVELKIYKQNSNGEWEEISGLEDL